MPNAKPQRIAIEHDDYHAQFIGRTADGRQFFLTTPFEPAIDDQPGCEYIALFLFDDEGNLVEDRIESLGPRATLDQEAAKQRFRQILENLGEVSFERIEVKPFAIERHGTTFGLITVEPEDDVDEWTVEMHPGNYMAFFEPWDSGEYDT